MEYLTWNQVVEIHRRLIQQSGGAFGIRDEGALESALAQAQMSFGGQDLYPTIAEKASALGFSLVMNHPFVDGNKRVGHAAMEVFLALNGYELDIDVDEQEQVILDLAAGKLLRSEFVEWVRQHIISFRGI